MLKLLGKKIFTIYVQFFSLSKPVILTIALLNPVEKLYKVPD